jgi:hypothetical protein
MNTLRLHNCVFAFYVQTKMQKNGNKKHFMLEFLGYCNIALFSIKHVLLSLEKYSLLNQVLFNANKRAFFEFITLCLTCLSRNFHKKIIFENVKLKFLNFDLKSVINFNEKLKKYNFIFMH